MADGVANKSCAEVSATTGVGMDRAGGGGDAKREDADVDEETVTEPPDERRLLDIGGDGNMLVSDDAIAGGDDLVGGAEN